MENTDTPSRSINLWRKPKDKYAPAVFDRLDAIQEELEERETRRSRDRATADNFRSCLRAICLDLFDAYLENVELQIGVHRDNTALSRKNPAIPEFVTARPFRDALDGLIAT